MNDDQTTPDGQASGPDPTLFLQLAISKEGVIAGVGKTRPIMETGISNLTEDTAPAIVHFADGQTQQWLMVRLEEPKQ